MTFDELIAECKNCTRCKLRKNATQVVPGAGNPHAEIMFIGEAPGKQEDIQGLPFVGASGKFLNEMLASINLKREDVYIANVIKCRPPDNRDPEVVEIQACADWLTEQLRFINPKVVITLGRFGMARFFGDKKISQIHGKVKFEGGRAYIPLYHPAVALYNGSMRQVLMKDFKVIRAVLERLDTGKIKEDEDPFSYIHNEEGGITGKEENAKKDENATNNETPKSSNLFE